MAAVSRRGLMIGGAAVALGAAAVMASKPRDNSGPRDPYFLRMQAALTAAGIATPTLVIDRARLDANIATLMGHLPDGMGYRIVVKSLPSLDLIARIRARTGTERLMTFNLPMLQAVSAALPGADQLLGKPLPVAAARIYFETLDPAQSGAEAGIQWLIDTPDRLAQYTALAETVGRPLRVNIELDVGLHRGGFVPGAALQAALQAIEASPRLIFAGFMGYEPHIPSVPEIGGWRDAALASAWRLYGEALDQARDVVGGQAVARSVRNAAGSPTYRYYQTTDLANEIAAGSALVKPTDFDTELLAPHEPAVFIAAPVIKTMTGTRIPGLEFLTGVNRAWDPNLDRTVFIYGGHWLAKPEDPPGLQYNGTFGRSSNQEMLNAGPGLDLAPDDFVFLRPTQSEAVFLQFGDIAVYDDGAIVDRWPVFPASA